jgi:beta-lactamase regulating signal transducer with metallopeptidase domain
MITALALYTLAIGGLLAAGALLLQTVAQRTGFPKRFIWFGALGLMVALTLVAPWRTASTSAEPDAATATSASHDASVVASQWADLRGHEAMAIWGQAPLRQAIEALARRVPPSLDRALGVLWATSSALLFALLLLILRRLDRARQRWPIADLLETPVRLSERSGPATYGVFAMDIVVPRALLACGTAEQEVVLAHEQEHRHARDPLLLASAAGLVSTMPWNPVAWWFLSRLRLAIELDCDARVLHRGVTVRRYGDVLLTMAASFPPPSRAAHGVALLASPRNLHRRLLAMTTPPTARSPILTAALSLGAVAIAITACTTDVPTAVDIRDADVTTVAQALGLPAHSGALEFVVDGEVWTEARARALAPEQIATIDVVGVGDPTQRRDQIRIATRPADTTPGAAALALHEGTRTAPTAVDEASAPPVTVTLRADRIVVRGAGADPAPLVIVDGEVLEAPTTLQTMVRPDQIASVEILKGEAAIALIGERGIHGVIRVTTKR